MNASTTGPMTTMALESPPRDTTSGRLESLSYEASDLALRHGALQARSSQLSAVVDELLAEVVLPPRLRGRLMAANEAAKIASGL